MADLVPVLKRNEIDNIVAGLAEKISVDYQGKELICIGILKGSFIFLSDLIRHLKIPVKIDFLGVSSYGLDSSSSGKISYTKELDIDIKNKHILIVEDIVDSGLSLTNILDLLKEQEPLSIKTCTLIDKSERREVEVNVDYAGHSVKEGFLVGYGLDYAEEYRNLDSIFHLKI